MTVDPATIDRLAREHPEAYRGGRIDSGRLRGMVTVDEAWRRATRCLGDGETRGEERAAYWVGWAKAAGA